jgi:3D (Asp-Asp-Asp) domain-containing protein
MNLRLGLPVAAILGASLVLAPAASPQTITATSTMIRPAVGDALVVMPADLPAPIQRGMLNESPPLHSTRPLELRVADAGVNVSGLDTETVCLAKVIHREAGDQPLKDQLALAERIMSRVKSPRSAKSICAVVKEPGQFFDTAHYYPKGDLDRWHDAVGVARIAREEAEPAPVTGAKGDTFGLKATLYITTNRDSGKDSIGCRVVPYRTVAVDGEHVRRHTILFIKETVGLRMPDGQLHDGLWYATDVGSAIVPGRIDLYTGKGRQTILPLMHLNLRTLTVTRVGKFDGCPSSRGAPVAAERRVLAER